MNSRKMLRFTAMCLGAVMALALTAFASEIGYTTDAGLRLRAAATTDSEIYRMLDKSCKLEILETLDGWYKVKCSDGKEGYVSSTYVKLGEIAGEASVEEESRESAPAEKTRYGVVTGGTINIRSGAGTEFDKIAVLYSGKGVTILGEENGWYKISFGSTVGYIRSDFLKETDSLPASVGETVAANAMNFKGVRYSYGGSSPNGFDCSGFTMYLYGLCGYGLPHSATRQYDNVGTAVSKDSLQPGDLVFFSDSSHRIGHVGLYIGSGQFIHARSSTGRVTVDSLSTSYYVNHYVGAKRVA